MFFCCAARVRYWPKADIRSRTDSDWKARHARLDEDRAAYLAIPFAEVVGMDLPRQ